MRAQAERDSKDEGERRQNPLQPRYDTRVLTAILSVLAAPSVALVLSVSFAAQAPARKVDIVSVTGCLREQTGVEGANWMLVAATDPVPSIANQASGADIPATPPAGKNTFRLIGIGEFNLPQMKDRTVVIRGLFIKDKVSRINVTSAVEAVASCAPGAPK